MCVSLGGNKEKERDVWITPPILPHCQEQGQKTDIIMPIHKSRSQARSLGPFPCSQEKERAQKSPSEKVEKGHKKLGPVVLLY